MFTNVSDILKVQREILDKTASEIIFGDEKKKLASRTMSSWILLATNRTEGFRIKEISFEEYKQFINFCEFKNMQKYNGVTTQKVTSKGFSDWKKQHEYMMCSDEGAKDYLIRFGTDSVISQGRHLVAYCEREYPKKYFLKNFYNWAVSNNFKFSMNDMDAENLQTLAKIAEKMQYSI